MRPAGTAADVGTSSVRRVGTGADVGTAADVGTSSVRRVVTGADVGTAADVGTWGVRRVGTGVGRMMVRVDDAVRTGGMALLVAGGVLAAPTSADVVTWGIRRGGTGLRKGCRLVGGVGGFLPGMDDAIRTCGMVLLVAAGVLTRHRAPTGAGADIVTCSIQAYGTCVMSVFRLVARVGRFSPGVNDAVRTCGMVLVVTAVVLARPRKIWRELDCTVGRDRGRVTFATLGLKITRHRRSMSPCSWWGLHPFDVPTNARERVSSLVRGVGDLN